MYATVPKYEVDGRIDRFRKLLSARGIDMAVIIHSPDLFYFTGVVQQGVMVIDVENDPVFFVRRSFERAVNESPLETIARIESLDDVVPYMRSRLKGTKKIGLEMDVMPVAFYQRIAPIFGDNECTDISILVRQARSIKSPFEIGLMRKSGAKLVGLLQRARDFIRYGRREIEVTADMIKFSLNEGHEGVIRMRRWNQDLPFGHVLSGENACYETFTDTPLGGKGRHPSTPFGPGDNTLHAGEPIIVDMMWVEEGYITDMTRVYSLGKIEDKELTRAHRVSMGILRKVEESFRPGGNTREILKDSMEIARENGLSESFMGLPGNRVNFLGHGIGLEVDELPLISPGFDIPLEAGMTFAIEPKFILRGKGAVGVENTYLITEEGFENLTVMEEDIIMV